MNVSTALVGTQFLPLTHLISCCIWQENRISSKSTSNSATPLVPVAFGKKRNIGFQSGHLGLSLGQQIHMTRRGRDETAVYRRIQGGTVSNPKELCYRTLPASSLSVNGSSRLTKKQLLPESLMYFTSPFISFTSFRHMLSPSPSWVIPRPRSNISCTSSSGSPEPGCVTLQARKRLAQKTAHGAQTGGVSVQR